MREREGERERAAKAGQAEARGLRKLRRARMVDMCVWSRRVE